MPKHLPKAVIWDLDGTLSDDRARAHFVEVEEGRERDWKSYFDAIGSDPPIAASLEVLRALHAAGNRVVFLTGRPEHTRRTTVRWLRANGLTDYDRLLMRPPGDHRPSGHFKVDEVKKLRREYELVCAFEDRIDVAEALRGAGVPIFLYGAGAEAAAEALEVLDADPGRPAKQPSPRRGASPKARAQAASATRGRSSARSRGAEARPPAGRRAARP